MKSNNTKSTPAWGLPTASNPSFGARLVQEGKQLHYLADRSAINGTFTQAQLQTLNIVFPAFVKQMETALRSGELDPRKARRFTATRKGMTLEADTNGSFGYVYIVIYPATQNEGKPL
ncbi:type IV toxin-antitoxin system YeeU family antitoxin [Citrobacter werkmanii]|uniref:type IV toxin-antitoxin system YeeU family antitoxin n=1 Tax=Citrobacter werkmanii TaxID=67827 RepID=UPI0013779A86|nr:type IV toxin-antitoxin system YeeU family antitoxin [Citrobacter werkmanii]NBD83710.1 type IV toxin-antitoxin system YeeU family antitoxin [Citrobacter werkmanii]HCB1597108.1 type IV toxin-antitoxin system YeeU family antitoxin [Citrobacter farmeri]